MFTVIFLLNYLICFQILSLVLLCQQYPYKLWLLVFLSRVDLDCLRDQDLLSSTDKSLLEYSLEGEVVNCIKIHLLTLKYCFRAWVSDSKGICSVPEVKWPSFNQERNTDISLFPPRKKDCCLDFHSSLWCS